MSTLATIFVKKCDGCQKIVVLKTDAEWESFQKLWYEGFDRDFCPVCLAKSETQRAIDSDELKRQKIAERVLELSENSKEVRVEYAH